MQSVANDSTPTIKLPPPLSDGKTSLEKTLRERRSIRHYKDLPLSLSDLSQLLWAAQGITAPGGRRTAPSAGALYPLEVYVVIGKVAGAPDGVYAYKPLDHGLGRITDGDVRAELGRAALGQASVRNAPVVLVLCAVYERTTGKYGERGIRYAHMEAGHAAQNVSLQAVSLGLGTVVIGAFQDNEVKAVLRLPDDVRPLALMPVGKK